MIINQQNLALVYGGFKTVYNAAFTAAEPLYPNIAMTVPSTGRSETYGWLGNFPKLREWVGDRIINNLATHAFEVKNRKFESTISVSRDDIADDKIGIFKPLVSEMGKDAREFPDDLCFTLMNAGFETLCYDGQPFFDTDHPVLDENGAEQSVSNMQAGSDPAWFLLDTSRAIKPFVYQERESFDFQSMDQPSDEVVFMRDEYIYGLRARANAGVGLWQLAFGSKAALDAANYELARIAMRQVTGDFGRKLRVKPTALVVGPSLEGDGRRLLKAIAESGATNEWAGSAELIVSEYLD